MDIEVFQKPNLTFDTLPPELRALVYDQLFLVFHIQVNNEGKLDTRQYPYQISAVSKLLRDETIPLLRDYTTKSRLRLLLENGRFPEHLRRRLPTHVYRSIRVIRILDEVKYDELKPSLSTFPNLLRLEFLKASDRKFLQFTDKVDCDALQWLEGGLFRRCLQELHNEQRRPREGLERDYLPDNALEDVCSKSRSRRGFDVSAAVVLTNTDQVIALDKEFSGIGE